MRTLIFLLTTLIICLTACGGMTFEEQIINDLSTKLPSGDCDDYPKGTVISNIKVGEIVDIGLDGMTDVSYELDYEIDGVTKHKNGAMLYLKRGSKYQLAVMGCKSDLTNK